MNALNLRQDFGDRRILDVKKRWLLGRAAVEIRPLTAGSVDQIALRGSLDVGVQ